MVESQVKFFLSLTEIESWCVTEGKEQFQKTQFSLLGLDNSYTYMDSILFMILCLARLEVSSPFKIYWGNNLLNINKQNSNYYASPAGKINSIPSKW